MSLVSLADVNPNAVEQFGGKATTLARLIQEGYTVPDGIAIEAQFSQNGRLHRIGDRVEEWARSQGSTPIIVRSSANIEDGAANSFAGLFESFIVPSDDVLEAVERCYSFIDSTRVTTYSQTFGIDPETIRLGVIVQKVVDADACGVCFTTHPVRDDDTVVIEAAAGIGHSEQDNVTPDRFVVSQNGELVTKDVSVQQYTTVLTETGLIDRESAVEEQVVTDRTAVRIAEQCLDIEEALGYQADIEWAIRDGTVFILQARPITT